MLDVGSQIHSEETRKDGIDRLRVYRTGRFANYDRDYVRANDLMHYSAAPSDYQKVFYLQRTGRTNEECFRKKM